MFFAVFIVLSCYFHAFILATENEKCFSYRTEIEIFNPLTIALSDEDFLLVLNTTFLFSNGDIQNSCTDLLFKDSIGGQILNHFFESKCPSPHTNVWMTIPYIGANETLSIFMYTKCDQFSNSTEVKWTDGEFVIMSKSDCDENGGWNNFVEMENKLLAYSDNPGSSNGNLHVHNISTSSGPGNYPVDYDSSATNILTATETHMHDINIQTLTTTTSLPPYIDHIFCKSSTFTSLPPQSIIPVVSTTLPLFVEVYDDVNDKFIMASTSCCDTGGSDVHMHFINGITGFGEGSVWGKPHFSSPNIVAIASHIHDVVGNTDDKSNIPSYLEMIFAQNVGSQELWIDEVNSKNFLFWKVGSSIPPKGFEFFSNFSAQNIFIRGTNNEPSFGSITINDLHHNHHYDAETIPTSDVYYADPGGTMQPNGAVSGHNHSHLSSNTEWERTKLPYFYLSLMKRKKVSIVITRVINKIRINEDVQTGLTFDPLVFTIIILIVAFVIIIMALLGIMGGFAGLWVVRNEKKKKSILHQELKIQNKGNPNLQIEKRFYNIPFKDVKLLEEIAKGGSDSVIYKAKWKKQIVAFKVFRTQDFVQNQHSFEDFEKEAKIVTSVSHPHVLRTFGVCVEQPRIGLVMQFVPNGTLESWILARKGKVSFLKKLEILEGISSGMDYLHDRNIIHRDLKPHNILIAEDDSPRIIDFGLSKIVDEMTTKYIGTTSYIAPEIIKGKGNYTNKVDSFSMAIIMYAILTENFYPYGKESEGIDYKVANNVDFRPKINEDMKSGKFDDLNCEWFVELMKTGWSDNPKDRPSFSVYEATFESEMEKLGGKEKGKEKRKRKKSDNIIQQEIQQVQQ